MDAVYWTTAAASLVAVWLNIHGRRACFAIWCLTNAAWCLIDLRHGIYAQAALQFIYFLLSVYGLRKWTRDFRRELGDDR